MTMPLVVLAVGALFVGTIVEPFTHWFSALPGNDAVAGTAPLGTDATEVGHHFDWLTASASTVLALLGVGLAFALYRRGTEQTPAVLEPVFALARNKLYVEDAYEATVVRPAIELAFLAKAFDGFLDGLVRLVSAIPRFAGQLTRPIQNGLVQFYALSMALGLAVFLSFVVFRVMR